jgi:hypothetical protein
MDTDRKSSATPPREPRSFSSAERRRSQRPPPDKKLILRPPKATTEIDDDADDAPLLLILLGGTNVSVPSGEDVGEEDDGDDFRYDSEGAEDGKIIPLMHSIVLPPTTPASP